MRFQHLLAQLSNEPWYITEAHHAECLSAHLHAFEMVAAPSVNADADSIKRVMALNFTQRPEASLEKETGIAHVHVFGAIARNLSPIQRGTGMTDFSQLHGEFSAAIGAGAKGILLDVHSPGGTVAGTPEAAALIADCPIPVVAHLQLAGSAAYYLVAGAKHLVASPSAEVGSIGVMMPRLDVSRALANAGIVADTITNTAGDLKGITSVSSLTETQRAHLVAQADSMFAGFRDHVRAFRDVPDSAMRGQTFSGQAAVAANLVDELGDMETARAKLLSLL